MSGASTAERVYRALLAVLLPRALREEAERELIAVFHDERERRRARRGSRVVFWARLGVDAAVAGLHERMRSVRNASERGLAVRLNSDGGGVGMDHLRKDLGFALRQLVRRPGFTAVLVLTLALGIGANTAVFSVVNAVLLRPLAYPDQDRLAVVYDQFPGLNLMEFPASGPEYLDYRDQNHSFEHLAAFSTAGSAITGDGEPERVQYATATWELFPALGLDPQLGRVFGEKPEGLGAKSDSASTAPPSAPTGEAVVVLSHALWQRRYGGRRDVIGRTLVLNGSPLTIIGVMPPAFRFPAPDIELWTPLRLDAANAGGRGSHAYSMVGRLRDGVTIPAARAEVAELMKRWAADPTIEHKWDGKNHPAVIASLRDDMLGDVTRPLWVMLAAVVVVLLIACANVANLLLVRGEARLREISVRTALGAGRWRIVAQLLTESVVMAGVGGLFGLALAWAGVRALRSLAPPELPRLDAIRLDPAVLAFTAGVTVLAGILFGLAPALQAGRTDVQSALREEGRGGSAGRGRLRLRQMLVVSETALAIVLLVGAGLLLQSFRRLNAVDPGFRPDQVLTLSVSVPAFKYPEFAQVDQFHSELREQVASIPGVKSVGEVRTAPLAGSLSPNDVEVDGFVRQKDGPPMNADVQMVTPGYFASMGTPIVAGRDFDARDNADASVVAVVSESLAQRYWPGRSALGGRIRQAGYSGYDYAEVVGVVKDVHQEGLDRPVRGTLYFVHAQSLRTWYPVRALTLVVRTSVDPSSLIGAIRARLHAMDAEVPAYQVQTLAQAVADSTSTRRFTLLLQLIFAVVALALAAIGLYGVMSFTVARRTSEIGIRMALGAERGAVLRMVVTQGMGTVAAASVIGVLGALATGRVLSSLLFGISPRDPATYATVVGALLLVALVACFVPARRASAVDPGKALRHE